MSNAHGPFRIEAIDYASGVDDLRAVRETVFVQEQRVPIEEEWDADDPQCTHVIARDMAGNPIGTGRLTPRHTIGRMAVLREWRGRGVGDALLHALLREARAQGLANVALNAQITAESFYLRHGFVPYGPRFMEAGIEHQAMRRHLDRPHPIVDRAAAVAVTIVLIDDARRLLCIRTRDLDPGLFDAPRVVEALRHFATRGCGNEVRILLHDAAAPPRAHSPLLALAQRLPSAFAFREVSDEVDRAYASAYVVNDAGGAYFRPLADALDGEAEAASGGRARQLLEAFGRVWQRSRAYTEYRALGI